MEVIQKCLAKDQPLNVWMILEEITGTIRETVCRILVEDLKNKKVCAHFSPLVTQNQKHQCAASFVDMTDDNRNVLK
jgi:hypothetical protein